MQILQWLYYSIWYNQCLAIIYVILLKMENLINFEFSANIGHLNLTSNTNKNIKIDNVFWSKNKNKLVDVKKEWWNINGEGDLC